MTAGKGARRKVVAIALAIGAALAFGADSPRAAEPPPPAAPRPMPPAPGGRPRLALVLSGGGARGAAHVGVLKVLEELHVRPDFIVGTSMGSIVGGLYAAGYSPADLERIIATTDWNDIFVDAVERRELSFRRKGDDATFLVPAKLRFKGWKPYLPPSVFGGQQLELYLRGLAIDARVPEDFNALPIPYRAVALDLETGTGVILGDGNIAQAMRASMAVPGVFSPVVIDGRTLVDGGAASNLPIGIAQALGADAVIAVDITSPLAGAEEIKSFFSVMSQWSSFATVANRLEDIRKLRPDDLLITPELGDIGFIDFKRTPEAIALGETAARAALERLKSFAVSEEEWRAFEARHRIPSENPPVVEELRITNSSWVNDRIIERHLDVSPGEPFDQESFDASVMRLYGLDYFGLMRDTYREEDGRGVLSLDVPAKPYGKNSLQFGASFHDDFSGNANYTLSLRHLLLAANRRGGEWENVGQLGDTRLFRTSFYQPLDSGLKWFVSPTAESVRRQLYIWANGDPSSQWLEEIQVGSLAVGRVLGNVAEVRLQAYYGRSNVKVIIGDPLPPGTDTEESDAGLQLGLRADTRDSTIFPHKGVRADLWYRDSMESLGSDASREVAHATADIAFTVGRVTLVPAFSGQSVVEGQASLVSFCELGGFLQLSGLGDGELRGERCILGRALAYVQLSHIDLGPLSTGVYGGVSLEAGNAYLRNGEPVTWESLRTGGSIFLGAKTPIGPAFLAWGTDDTGDHRLYFVIGDRF